MGLHEQRALALRGDPGFFGALGGAVKGFFSGGIPGAIGGAVTGFRGSPPPPTSLPYAGPPVNMGPPMVPRPGIGGAIQRVLPGGQTGMQPWSQPAGYHPNKTGYYTASGYVAPGSKLVKNRKRNFANGRALRRAITRVQGFEREVKRSRKALRSLSRI